MSLEQKTATSFLTDLSGRPYSAFDNSAGGNGQLQQAQPEQMFQQLSIEKMQK